MTRALNCDEVITKLLEFLDRELDPETEQDMARHLEECRACFTRAEFERRLRAKVMEAGEVEAPARLRRRVRALMEHF